MITFIIDVICFSLKSKKVYSIWSISFNLQIVATWRSGYHYCTTSFNKAQTHVLGRFKSCSRSVEDSRWWGFLTMVPAGNKAKRLSSVIHTTKTIHHHYWNSPANLLFSDVLRYNQTSCIMWYIKNEHLLLVALRNFWK